LSAPKQSFISLLTRLLGHYLNDFIGWSSAIRRSANTDCMKTNLCWRVKRLASIHCEKGVYISDLQSSYYVVGYPIVVAIILLMACCTSDNIA
jgi:hypothetical protein